MAIYWFFSLRSSWGAILFIMDVKPDEKIAIIIGILFFGFGLFLFPQKFLDKTPGLIIDEHGITDNVTKPKIGIIVWSDISYVKVSRIEVSNKVFIKMLLIFVHNPREYLDRVSGLKSRGLKNNYAMVGTPFAIPSSILKMKLEDIEILINAKLTKFHFHYAGKP